MARVKRGVTSHARHKKVLEQAKGFYGRRSTTIRTAKAAVDKAGQYAYRDRRNKKRAFRIAWLMACHGDPYSDPKRTGPKGSDAKCRN